MNNEYTKSLAAMVINVKEAAKVMRRGGIVSMSMGNLRQVVSTKGITIEPSQFDALLKEAVSAARLTSYFHK